jgi:integrase
MAKYTEPKINRGKAVTHIPRGSSRAKEQAKNNWHINYTYDGKQIRVTESINRIKDPDQKEIAAQALLGIVKEDLANGFNPNDKKKWVETVLKNTCTLKDAIKSFEKYHIKHNSRPKTISTYLSKLHALESYYPEKQVKDITTTDLEKFIQGKINDKTYSHASVKAAKRIFSTFFNVCIKLELVENNPFEGFDKKIKSFKEVKEQHIPFSVDDLNKLLSYLDENDPYAAFFCRMIYFTCLRPAEIRGLKIKNIDLVNALITIPASVKKVTTNNDDDVITINKSFMSFLEKLNIDKYPSDYYLTGCSKNILGPNKVGVNTPYQKVIKALKKIGLDNKGYTLYSLKHTSNIVKHNNQWSIAEIMKANRHTSLENTLVYLKKIGIHLDLREKIIPVI